MSMIGILNEVQFRVLKHVDEAESGEEYFREVPGGMARFVKLDRRRRAHHGFVETDALTPTTFLMARTPRWSPWRLTRRRRTFRRWQHCPLLWLRRINMENFNKVMDMQVEVLEAKITCLTATHVSMWTCLVRRRAIMFLLLFLWWAWTGMTTRRSCGTIRALNVREPCVYSK
jgi:hypothetical protein